ncbi:hypothetical protein [Polaromonas sp. UC242_47]|uniref:hypothetical protein n=1 Tax=Polaromonas sp. UC242_47 TaxID=3374626 RepID=UPI0037AAF3F1
MFEISHDHADIRAMDAKTQKSEFPRAGLEAITPHTVADRLGLSKRCVFRA